ncbi:MAG: asparagine synthase (glutamine-hydrolyzing) [Desulfobulbus sp.]|nr:asparagine synthase (glutamine-hydrolyzing) [Desulfobulbus sp.]
MGGISCNYLRQEPIQPADRHSEELVRVHDMVQALCQRGPEAQRVTAFGHVVFGHAKFNNIGFNGGDQPIYNEDQSVAVVCDGEIYNHQELRRELIGKGHSFQTDTDIEVIVHLYEEVGSELFTRLHGMFAVVLHDCRKNVVLAARDRLGEKPLVYWQSAEKVLFASELKVLMQHPDIQRKINDDALALYFNSLYIPAPHTIVAGVNELLPAHYLLITEETLTPVQYWQPRLAVNWNMTEQEAVEGFLSLFQQAVAGRIGADEQLGVFLSGGVDSSAVTAFASQYHHDRLRSFCVGMQDGADERPFARTVADLYRTDHQEVCVTDRVEDVVTRVCAYFDEPFGDSSAIPTYLAAREAGKHVSIVLTGDGADELFAGYSYYLDQRYLFNSRIISKLVRETDAFCMQKFGHTCADRLYARKGHDRSRSNWYGMRSMLDDKTVAALLGRPFTAPSTFFSTNGWLNFHDQDPLTVAFSHDVQFFLSGDLLKKVDVASKMASVQCRNPFLDHRLVEFALTIPPQLKMRNREPKYILKQAMQDYLPHEVLFRQKQGFGAPVGAWMRDQLRELVQDSLARGCRSEQYLDRKTMDGILTRFYEQGEVDYRLYFALWMLLMFELWLAKHWHAV